MANNTRIIDLTESPSINNVDYFAIDSAENGTKSVAFRILVNTLTSRVLPSLLDKILQGTNVTLTKDTTNNTLTISSRDTTYNEATQAMAGLMAALDKKKLDNMATLIGSNTLPTTAITLTGAIAEHETDIGSVLGTIGSTPMGTTATTLTGAIAEVRTTAYSGKITIDTTEISGSTDGDLYIAIQSLDWENDVIE